MTEREIALRHSGYGGDGGIVTHQRDLKLRLLTAKAWLLEAKGPESPGRIWGTCWDVMTNRRAPLRTRLRAAQVFVDRLDPIPRPEVESGHTTVNAVQVNLIAPVRAGEGQEGASAVPASLSITLAGNGHQEGQNGH